MSLLSRAKKFRKTDESGVTDSSDQEFVFDKSSGISEEDQKEILTQIEQISQQSRISSSPALLNVKANKRGFFFPVIVNIAALAVLGGGFLTLSAFFKQSESELRSGASGLRSAEGKLIQEIKKETEARLKEKEQEINSIQSRLSEIDKERQELQTNMDSKVKEKEDALRKSLEAELSEERRKLSAQGLSEAAIAERMKKLEDEKASQFNSQLSDFRKDAEAERAKMEANLQKLQSDFQQNLANLNTERQKIAAESRQREDSLRAQLDAQTRALETERTKSKEQLSQAETEIKRLSEQRERTQLVESQIFGFYNTAKSHLSTGNLEEAKRSLTSMKSYLNDESIVNLPGIQRRREIDLVVVDAFTAMVDDALRRQRESMSISDVLKTGAMVEEIRRTVGQANTAFGAGNLSEAERLYTAALSQVPEVLTSHEYFLKKKVQEQESRIKAVNDGILKAENTFKAGNFRQAVAEYTEALAITPVSGAGGVLQNIQKSGYELLTEEQRQFETRNAPAFLTEGNTALNNGRYPQAVAAYVTLLQRYPLSSQAPQAVEGIRKAVDAQNNLMEGKGETAAATIASLQREKSSLEATIVSLRESHRQELGRLNEDLTRQSATTRTDFDRQITANRQEYDRQLAAVQADNRKERETLERSFQTRIAELESQVASLRQGQQQDQAEKDRLSAAAAAPREPVIPPETQRELARLQAVEEELARIKRVYRDYASKEDGVFAGRGEEAGIVEAKLYLDTFLATENIRTSFPGFEDRIKRYDRAFFSAGRNEALMEVADIALRVYTFDSKTDIDRYITEELERQKNNQYMVEYLRTLRRITR
jgi:hypothetical protein